MAYEIEKKYLVKELPNNYKEYPAKEIMQGYYSESPERPNMRVRKKGDKYYKTYKTGSGVKRTEEETEISREDFENLWPLSRGKRIYKTRYEIPYEGFTIELDIFEGKLDSLILAEVEFESVEESEDFIPPSWFGQDVTDDPRYKNSSLAETGFPV